MDDLDLDIDVAAGLAERLAQPASPAEELERAAQINQEALAAFGAGDLKAQRTCRSAVAELEAERARLRSLHEADMRRIDQAIAETEARTEAELVVVRRLAAGCRSALEALP